MAVTLSALEESNMNALRPAVQNEYPFIAVKPNYNYLHAIYKLQWKKHYLDFKSWNNEFLSTEATGYFLSFR